MSSVNKEQHQLCQQSVISPQNIGEKSGFSEGFCLGDEVTSDCLGRENFEEEYEFSDFCMGALIFGNLQQNAKFQFTFAFSS